MKATKATIKSFINKNVDCLYINVKSSFDGMYDCCMSQDGGFTKAIRTEENLKNTLGVLGAWFVGQSRDYFSQYDENGMTGYDVSNCCGRFILAIKN
jgi:hypothetical protein